MRNCDLQFLRNWLTPKFSYLRLLVGGEVSGDGDPTLRVQLQRGDDLGVVALGKVAEELDAVPPRREEGAEGEVQRHPLPRYLRGLEGAGILDI